MTKRAKRIQKSITSQKNKYGCCVFTASIRMDGAHIIPRDVMPELADCEDNIIPMKHEIHIMFDKIGDREFEKRFNFCVENALPDFRGAVRQQIERLKLKIGEKKWKQ